MVEHRDTRPTLWRVPRRWSPRTNRARSRRKQTPAAKKTTVSGKSENTRTIQATYLCDDGSISLDQGIVPEEGEVRGRLPITLERRRERLSFRQKLQLKRWIHEITLGNALRDKRSGFRTLCIEKTFKTRLSYLVNNRNSFKAFRDS